MSGCLLRPVRMVWSVGNICSRSQGCYGIAVMGARVGRVAVGGPAAPSACPRASLFITGARYLLSGTGRRTSVGGEGSAVVRAADTGRRWRRARSDIAFRHSVQRRLCTPSEGGGPRQGQWSARPPGKGTAAKTEFKRGVGGSGGGGRSGGGGAGKGGQGPDPGSAPP